MAVVLFDRGYPSFGNFDSAIPIVVVGMKSYLVVSLTTCILVENGPEKSEAMCQFFDKRGYPVSVFQVGHLRAQQIDRQSALQTAEK